MSLGFLARGMLLVWTIALLSGSTAGAEVAVSANDGKPKLTDGVVTVDPNRAPDNIVILDLKGPMPKVIATVDNVPTSVVGPPTSVAITPDESLALVSASTKVDPNDPTKFVNDNALTVIDLKANPPAVIAKLEAGPGATGISINKQGTLALVANRGDGTVSIFTISGKTVTPAGKVDTGNPKSVPNHPAISPDGTFALLTRSGDHMTTVLSIDGSKVEVTKRNIFAGLSPDAIEITPDGAWAVMANIGMGQGDADTISLGGGHCLGGTIAGAPDDLERREVDRGVRAERLQSAWRLGLCQSRWTGPDLHHQEPEAREGGRGGPGRLAAGRRLQPRRQDASRR